MLSSLALGETPVTPRCRPREESATRACKAEDRTLLFFVGDLQAVLVANPTVAAAVAEICMVGLATTVHATRGPPKPDKARIDRLAYVVSAWPPSFHACTP